MDYSTFTTAFLPAATKAGVVFPELLATANGAAPGYNETRLRFLLTGAIPEADATADDRAVHHALAAAFSDMARPVAPAVAKTALPDYGTLLAETAAGGWRECLLPAMPPDARLSPTTRIAAADRGKVPGTLLRDGSWCGISGWPDREATTAADIET